MRSKHFLQLIGLSALWGASFLFIRIASPVLGPAVLAALRVALAAVTLAILMQSLSHAWPFSHWRRLSLLALLTVAAPFLLYAWAALHLPSGYSALLNTAAVLFGALASAWLKEDTLTARKLLGCASGFLGVALIVRLGPVEITATVVLAVLACLGAAACYGVGTPLMKRATAQTEPLALAAAVHVLALPILLPFAAWNAPQAHFSPGALAAVGVLGVCTSGLAYWAHLRIMRFVTPVAAMAPTFLIPVFGVAWGHIFLGEALGSGLFAGGALVLIACTLVTGFNPLKWASDAAIAKP
jgi:drug/metabolite transporter (DMT)-like permease